MPDSGERPRTGGEDMDRTDCLPWCTQVLAFIELPVDNVNSQGFNGSFAVHTFVRN
jgi:hypothetical protein